MMFGTYHPLASSLRPHPLLASPIKGEVRGGALDTISPHAPSGTSPLVGEAGRGDLPFGGEAP
jgi:hypothetical protein